MRKLLDSLENAQKAWVDLKKDAKGAHKLFKDYQPEEDLVKREKIIYTGSVKDFVRLTLPSSMTTFPGERADEPGSMIRALDEVFEIHPNGCPEQGASGASSRRRRRNTGKRMNNKLPVFTTKVKTWEASQSASLP